MKMLPLSIQEREDLLQIYSDFHKDAYGFRPRWNYSALSDEQLLKDFDTFSQVCEDNAKEEAIQLQADIKAFETLIDKTIHLGAGDRKTALRWIVDGENEWDVEHIAWRHGILFSDYGRGIIEEMREHCLDILQGAFES